jgi:hypothetical protein
MMSITKLPERLQRVVDPLKNFQVPEPDWFKKLMREGGKGKPKRGSGVNPLAGV